MLYEVLLYSSLSVTSGLIGFFVSKKITKNSFSVYEESAKAKATVIESEAEKILENATLHYKTAKTRAENDLAEREANLKEREKAFLEFKEYEEKLLEQDRVSLDMKKNDLEKEARLLAKLQEKYEKKLDEVMHSIEHHSGMTQEEAKTLLLQMVEERSRGEIAHIVRRYEEEAKQQAKEKANFIIAQAVNRFAGEFASERLTNIVHLDSDELKGRIIGKEGRNIKSLETILGVDIIIDDTPNTIVVSSFNLYRRSIATKTLELLIEDGRIQPARIEDIYQKVCDEFESRILAEGEEVVADMGVGVMHPELVKLIGRLRYRASYGQNALAHTLEVAHLAGMMASEMGGNATLAKRAGLLHDIGKALTHDVDGNHIDLGAEICKRYNEDEVVINAIYAHHGHQEILSIECGAVCAADALSAARPGARREVLESFLKRVVAIEDIAMSFDGVKQAYAINAGREVRVIVNADLVNDDESILLAKEIAKNIEEGVQYPGEIKVNVIRESRAIEFAK
ncbi:FIG002344: Hydrolase (HAD superfamily) [hydrothermal vent metagenome]|uniref:FIG002344: Hydrolase (HAD superfamily) n=1 Tax=hydrothermal vent metagenome TaxID=652676 RepID=A0A1W1D583_9ZZZZ